MKRILLATVGVAPRCGHRRHARVRKARRHDRCGPRRGNAAAAARERQVAQPVHHRRQVRRAAVRLHRRAGEERRLRRRDRALVRALRVRTCAARHVRLRTDRPARAADHERPRRPRDLDLHVHGRPRHAHRLLARVLEGDGPPAREERRLGAEALRHRGQAGRDDERLRLRPLDEELLQEHGGDRRRHVHERDARVQPGPRRCGHVRRRGADPGRGRRPHREDHRRRLPRGAVRHRLQAGLDRDEGVGRLAPRADEGEGSVPADPEGQRPGPVRELVLEDDPAAEQHVRVRRPRRAERGHRVPSRSARSGGGLRAASRLG